MGTRLPGIVKWTLSIDDLDNIVDTISLVDEPAIEVDWQVFAKDKDAVIDQNNIDEMFFASAMAQEQSKNIRFQVPESRFQKLRGQNIIVAPSMVADKLIFRTDELGNPYYGFFDAESIRNAAYAFQKYKLTDSFNIMHDSEQIAEGVYLAESWIVENTRQDKAHYFGYQLPPGSWMTMLKIDNDQLFTEYIETGLLRGLSVEAFVVNQVILSKAKES